MGNRAHHDDPFAVDGEMAALMRAKDWWATPLGPVSVWPRSLRTIVRVLLTSRFAMWMGWGKDLTFLYNDAYAGMTLGAKHPWALGRPSREVWAEIWPDIEPRIETVLLTGQATWDEQLLLFLERSGYREETYHTFSYSPVSDDTGMVSGLLCVVTEETERVVGERRLALLRDTAAAIASTITEPELFAGLDRALAGSKDLPFTLTYLFDRAGERAQLAARTGIAGDHPAAAPSIVFASDPPVPWRLDPASPSGETLITLSNHFSRIPDATWGSPPTHAIVLPIAQPGQKRAAGMFVAALNPCRPFDAGYRSFVDLFVGQIASGLANVHAYEEERRRAQALAELDRAKTAFFSNVSHEFRTPLTLLLGPLDDVRRAGDELPPGAREQLDVAHRNSQRLLKLVNTLLDFSRIEAGRVRAHYEPVNLAELTTDLSSTFRSAMEKAGLTFTVECGAVADPVYVDREMWEKIVLNLLSNAFKFTMHGSVAVSLRQEGPRAVLVVRDTGTGIPAHELPRVFERFHRVEGTGGRSHEGSGIGLALVQELVKLHGGELTATSEHDRGSAFTVSIPVGAAHLPAEQIGEPAMAIRGVASSPYVEEALRWLPAETPGEAEGQGETMTDGEALAIGRVLLADDNADMRDYASRLLAERWQVEAVGNGRQALSAARARRPDVIVTDAMMPELDGFGLLRELRADPDLATIPVIMVSARAGEEARIEGLAASADDYLVKPFTARDLLARVDHQLVRARARELEQQHMRRLAQLFTHAPVAIAVMTGRNHVFELTNSRYDDLVAGRRVIGQPVRDALPELAGQGIFELLDRVRDSGEPYVGHSRRVILNRGPGGTPEECYFDFVYQPIFSNDGRVESIVTIAHDVTLLAAAKRDAETANRLKDEFLATLSHELRTPLNAVLGYLQMLRAGAIEAQRVPAVLETIERNAKLQEQLISDVLDVSRIITGKLRLDVRAVDLRQVIQEALDTVGPAATAKGVRLQSTLDHPGGPVAGDAQRLQQIIWNLLSNAIKFTPRGGRVQVRLQRIDSHVEITVSDTGEGIAPEFLPQLFQRFRQADSTFTRSHGGLGLGLAISRHLVEAHGGHIEATSPGKGQGTTIRIELPLMIVDEARTHDERVHSSVDEAHFEAFSLADLNGRRVLLVDDDADALDMAKDALTIAGATVVTAADAADALAALDREAFDAAILDIGLPGMDGYELLKAIRARPRDRQGAIPAAALTAYARAVDRARSLQAGFQMHLAKPIQPNELAAAVLALVGPVGDRA
jgi:signal transduction histidine kinase/DNA-binding response OmpR family regulator